MDFFSNRPGSKPTHELPPEIDELTEAIIAACIEVHRFLGPGLNESIYEEATCHEFELRRISYAKQVEMPVFYKGNKVGVTRVDLLVDGKVIIELKACQQLAEVPRAQLLTYLQITRLEIGLLINFNHVRLVDGIRAVIHPHVPLNALCVPLSAFPLRLRGCIETYRTPGSSLPRFSVSFLSPSPLHARSN